MDNRIALIVKDRIVDKADKKTTLQNLELLNDSLSCLSKEMLLKASLGDVMALSEQGCKDCPAVRSEVVAMQQAWTQYRKEVKASFEEQTSLNEVLCAENCVARWLWKGGQVTGKGAVHWDLESVNTCPENYLL